MLLAGDLGGTKTLLGLFQRAPRRPRRVELRTYPTTQFNSFTEILEAFESDVHVSKSDIEAVAIGVAGPVLNQRASLTNIGWSISAEEITQWCGSPKVTLLNDLQSIANSVEVLAEDELLQLQKGVPRPGGNAVVIAAGTGLGESYLHPVNGRLRPVPSEGGHADFAARTDCEMDLARMLRNLYGRAEVESVLCGPGLLNVHRFTHQGVDCPALVNVVPGEEPAAISKAAIAGTCASCVKALDMFVSAYGSEAGNLAIRGLATAGVYVGGGIAPKILPLIQRGGFMEAFRSKPPMDDLLSRIPVNVILNSEAGVVGAAVYASEM